MTPRTGLCLEQKFNLQLPEDRRKDRTRSGSGCEGRQLLKGTVQMFRGV